MKIIQQSAELMTIIPEKEMLERLELYGRTCYQSEHRIGKDTASKFVKGLMKNNHLSVLEHINLTFRFITDRGVTHELVRHRLASYSQESTRYVKYQDLEVVQPVGMSEAELDVWRYYMNYVEGNYRAMINYGLKPEQARTVLPNSTKTEIVMTANLREWLHIIQLRTSKAAHPQIRDLIGKAQEILAHNYPTIFGKTDDR